MPANKLAAASYFDLLLIVYCGAVSSPHTLEVYTRLTFLDFCQVFPGQCRNITEISDLG